MILSIQTVSIHSLLKRISGCVVLHFPARSFLPLPGQASSRRPPVRRVIDPAIRACSRDALSCASCRARHAPIHDRFDVTGISRHRSTPRSMLSRFPINNIAKGGQGVVSRTPTTLGSRRDNRPRPSVRLQGENYRNAQFFVTDLLIFAMLISVPSFQTNPIN